MRRAIASRVSHSSDDDGQPAGGADPMDAGGPAPRVDPRLARLGRLPDQLVELLPGPFRLALGLQLGRHAVAQFDQQLDVEGGVGQPLSAAADGPTSPKRSAPSTAGRRTAARAGCPDSPGDSRAVDRRVRCRTVVGGPDRSPPGTVDPGSPRGRSIPRSRSRWSGRQDQPRFRPATNASARRTGTIGPSSELTPGIWPDRRRRRPGRSAGCRPPPDGAGSGRHAGCNGSRAPVRRPPRSDRWRRPSR